MGSRGEPTRRRQVEPFSAGRPLPDMGGYSCTDQMAFRLARGVGGKGGGQVGERHGAVADQLRRHPLQLESERRPG